MRGWLDFRSWRGLVTLHVLGVLGLAATLLALFVREAPGRMFGAVGGGFGGLIGCTYTVWLCINALLLRARLRERGYAWVSLFTAVALVASTAERAWRLPTRDEAAALPGYDDKLDSLIRLAMTR